MINRRLFLQHTALGIIGPSLFKSEILRAATSSLSYTLRNISNEMYIDKRLGLLLPMDCKARIVARSGSSVLPSSDYKWHGAPDGGACFSTVDGGWIYVSNCEQGNKQGGVGAVRFDKSATIIDAYSILKNTSRNCAGGKTLWGSWLSCEENGEQGQVYECDPLGIKPGRVLPELGSFNHEAVTADPYTGYLYMTEDYSDGALYRFIPEKKNNLLAGRLEVAINDGNKLDWKKIEDPHATVKPCRYQVKETARFKGGEGITFRLGNVYFTTKNDNRIWQYNTKTNRLSVYYDVKTSANPILSGVDNIAVAPTGELLIAEDGGDMQIVGLSQDHKTFPLITVLNQDRSELTGLAFTPDGRRLYFSSQRGYSGKKNNGITYEVEFPQEYNIS